MPYEHFQRPFQLNWLEWVLLESVNTKKIQLKKFYFQEETLDVRKIT